MQGYYDYRRKCEYYIWQMVDSTKACSEASAKYNAFKQSFLEKKRRGHPTDAIPSSKLRS
jgi:hypothetical protein